VRHDTFHVLRLSRRHDLAARLLPEVHELHGDTEAAHLLPACPPGTVAQWLPRLDPPDGVLMSLARTAPLAVAAYLVRAAEQSDDHYSWFRLIRRTLQLVTTAARQDPGAALLLAEKAPRLMTAEATAVALRRPRDLLAAVRRAGVEELPLADTPLSRGVRRALRGLAPEELAALASVCRTDSDEHRDASEPSTADPLLALVPSGMRARLVRERVPATESRHKVPVRAIAALAPEERAEFVRPLMSSRARRRNSARARFGVLLPLAEAEPLYREMADNFAAHERRTAWAALLAAAAYHGDPAAYGRVFTSCERAWHDQFSVRQAALAQAATAPARLLAAVPYAALRDAALTTVQSRDSVPYTLESAERLLRRVVLGAAARRDHERAAAVALLLAQVVADPRFPARGAPLAVDRPTARAIWAAAGPGAGPGQLLGLAALLERHTAALPGCDAFLARTALGSDDPAVAARAAGVWLADPAEREERVAELLASGRPFAGVPRVLWTVARRRTDLLDDLLAASGTGTWVPRLPGTVGGRWLPAQRAALTRRIEAVAADGDVPMRQRADAAALLRDAPALRRLVAGEFPQPVVAAALTALGQVADRDALGPLLEHAATGGVRGRAAMAALRRLLDGLPDAEAVEWLSGIVRDPRAPVGSRKEAARALTARPDEAAFDALLAAWDVPGQHRDVLAVLAAPLTARIQHPAIAARLRRHLGHAAVRSVVLSRRRDAVPAAARQAYAHFLAGLVREGGGEEVVTAACTALVTVGGAEGADAVVADGLAVALADPARPHEERFAAGTALTGTARSGAALTALRAALGALADRGELRLLDRLATDRRWRSAAVEDAYADALERAGLPRAATRAAFDAAVGALREGDAGLARWDRCLRLAERHPNALGRDGSLHLPTDRREALRALLAVARALGERPGTLAGLLAVLLVRSGGEAAAWADPWPAELDALRAHADPDVAEAALVAQLRRETSPGG
jgi:hypothetical protein